MISVCLVLWVGDFIELRYVRAVRRVLLRLQWAGYPHLVDVGVRAEIEKRRVLRFPSKPSNALFRSVKTYGDGSEHDSATQVAERCMTLLIDGGNQIMIPDTLYESVAQDVC
jgi:hypothetical protein